MFAFAVSFSANANQYTRTSLLSKGHWVKIHVDSSSVYRLDYATLRRWGFNEPEKVSVYGYGSVEQAHALDTAPDDLPQIQTVHIDDAIYFYGEGDRRVTMTEESSINYIDNYYSNGSNYFLTADGGSPLDIPITDHAQATKIEDTHIHLDLRTPREYNIHSAGVFFYSRNFAHRPEGLDCHFDAPDYDGNGLVAYRYIYRHDKSDLQFLDMKFTGDVTAGNFSIGGMKANKQDHLLYSRSTLKKIQVKPTSDKGFGMHFSSREGSNFNLLSLSEVYFTYSRKNILHNSPLHLRYEPGKRTHTVRICSADKNVIVWDISSPRNITSLKTNPDSEGNLLVTAKASTPDTPLTLCAFSTECEVPTPALIGDVECQNLHSMPSIDYLIVTTDALKEEAERLAAAHREIQGMKVAVVTQDEVFNEFSSGSRHPNGLRKFVRLLSKRQDRPLRHLLLLGASTYDSRKFTIEDDIDYLIGYETESLNQARYSSNDFATDLYFGFTDENIPENLALLEEKLTLSIGRAPILSPSEARIFVDKSISYLKNPKLAGRFDHAVLGCCEGNESAHFYGSETLRDEISRLCEPTTCSRIYAALYPKLASQGLHTFSQFSTELARGPFFVNYTGHAGKYKLGEMVSSSKEKSIHYGSMPIMYIAACETSPIDESSRGIGAQIFLNPDGPIAVIGSGRSVYLTDNHRLNEEFVSALYKLGSESGSIGEVWRDAINATSNSLSRRINNFCYNLLADPALPVRRPSRMIKLDSTEGKEDIDILSATSLSPITIKGKVTHFDGTTDNSFNGLIHLTLFDSPKSVTLYQHDKSDAKGELVLDETPIHETTATVKGGRWTFTFTPPIISRSGEHRLTFIAYADKGDIAIGSGSKVKIDAPDENAPTDIQAPEIELYLDSPSMIDGDETSPTPILYATIQDSGSGLNTNSSAIEATVHLMLDGMTSLSPEASRMINIEPGGTATLTFQLPKLRDGKHMVSLSARDVAGNSVTRNLNFTVVSEAIKASLETDTKIAREEIEFKLIHDRPQQTESRIIIRDMLGNTVHSAETVTFPYTYDLRDSDGKLLPDGRYRVSAILKAYPRFGSTPEIEFTIAKPSI